MQKEKRKYRTRPDPFIEVWHEVQKLLQIDSGLEATVLMEWLNKHYPQRFTAGQLRTLQRRVKNWHLLEDIELAKRMLWQDIQPGRQSRSGFIHCTELEIIIAGEHFPHLLFYFMLPYSQWEHVEVAPIASFEILAASYSRAVASLGMAAPQHLTDNWTNSTLIGENSELENKWQCFLAQYGVIPGTDNSQKRPEDSVIEPSQDLFKLALDQRMKMRGTRTFESLTAYKIYLQALVNARNGRRRKRIAEELKSLQPIL